MYVIEVSKCVIGDIDVAYLSWKERIYVFVGM
jgi:hypothetical protein